VLDEPTASLDRTIRRNIAELLLRLQHELGLSYLLITHDIGAVRRLAAQSLVMFRGHLVESGPTTDVISEPRHPYTKALVSSELVPKFGAQQTRYLLRPRPPGLSQPTPGCPLANVCPLVIPDCDAQMPPLMQVSDDHYSACIRWQDVPADRFGAADRDSDGPVDLEGVKQQ
jgi:oligopeptide/dipeptide ABC transporter ATP-binding protein